MRMHDSHEAGGRATDLVERYAPLDIDAHAEHWRAGGWQGAPHNDSAMR